jgi:hypothetical protein
MTIPPTKTLNDYFNAYAQTPEYKYKKWNEYWYWEKWQEMLSYYDAQHWDMIPIMHTEKAPLKPTTRYSSHGAKGPYLSLLEARQWAVWRFNIACVASNKLIWADCDNEALWHDNFADYLCMRTAKGFAIPLLYDDFANKLQSEATLQALRKLAIDFRMGIQYELVPYSITCANSGHGKRHGNTIEHCITHNYRVRYWINGLTKPMMGLRNFIEVVTQ